MNLMTDHKKLSNLSIREKGRLGINTNSHRSVGNTTGRHHGPQKDTEGEKKYDRRLLKFSKI